MDRDFASLNIQWAVFSNQYAGFGAFPAVTRSAAASASMTWWGCFVFSIALFLLLLSVLTLLERWAVLYHFSAESQGFFDFIFDPSLRWDKHCRL